MNPQAREFYQSKNETCSKKLKQVSKKIKQFAWYRLVAFTFIILPFALWGWNGWFTAAPAGIFTFVFFFLIKKNVRLSNQKKKFEVLQKIADDELLALQHTFSHFENGNDFLDTGHFYAYDLDIFGEDSIYQFINRTSTQSGRTKLGEWLRNPPLEKTDIEKRQEAVKELSVIPNWRLHFLTNGRLFNETKELSDEIKSWSGTDLKIGNATKMKWLIILVPALTFLSIIPAVSGITNYPLYLMLVIQWLLVFLYRKEVALFFDFFGRKTELLGKYRQLLEFIEEREFQAPFLVELQQKVNRPEKASHTFQQLKNLVHQFEYRQNIVVNLIVNSLLLWDIRCVYKLWKWHKRHRKKLTAWLNVVAETDALISLANFTYNQPDYVFPEVHDGGFVFETRQMGHPLLSAEKRVCNDLEITGWSKVLIITGANMAGKSTFLRTVGVNMVLARMGAPVCAEKMKFAPIKLYTNMRTTDSLLKDESYFFAELKRIKGVLDRLENGERIFVILDEMLKGTNSIDKLSGSKELIKKLLHLKAVALIATHDLKLSEMEEEFPQQVYNKCFEIRIKNDELIFDYKLSNGVTQTMNATFLMKKMGII